MNSKIGMQSLLNKVIEQIKSDIHCGDVEAIEELLKFCPLENLVSYLSEEESFRLTDED